VRGRETREARSLTRRRCRGEGEGGEDANAGNAGDEGSYYSANGVHSVHPHPLWHALHGRVLTACTLSRGAGRACPCGPARCTGGKASDAPPLGSSHVGAPPSGSTQGLTLVPLLGLCLSLTTQIGLHVLAQVWRG